MSRRELTAEEMIAATAAAGEVVGAVVLGRDFVFATIVGDCGLVFCRPAPTARDRAHALSAALVGQLAAERVGKRPFNFGAAVRRAVELIGDVRAPERAFEHALKWAREILDRNGAHVARVALELARAGEIGPRRLREVVLDLEPQSRGAQRPSG